MGIVSLQSYRFEGYRLRVAGNGIVAKVIIIIIIVHMHIVIGIALVLIIMCETGERRGMRKRKGRTMSQTINRSTNSNTV